MACAVVIAAILLTIVGAEVSEGQTWLGWVFGDGGGGDMPPDTSNQQGPAHDHEMSYAVDVRKAPFEMSEGNAFVKELEKAGGVTFSELDRCQHGVVLSLQTRCATLSEEEISKIGVRLLNCQSHVEGRAVYACTSSMSLKKCTEKMDADAWTAYHIMSNRARAVCYAARQQQFALRTELTVNKLINSAEDQISNLQKIKEGQENLGRITSATFSEVAKGQNELAAKQMELRNAQDAVHGFISKNLRELSQEKVLIGAVQSQLRGMAEALQHELSAAMKQVAGFVEVHKQENARVMQDFSHYQRLTREASEKSEKDALANGELLSQIKQDLVAMNATVKFLQQTMANLEKGLAADSEGRFEFLIRVLPHVVLFIVSSQFLLLVNAPMILRCFVMLSIAMNGFTEYSEGYEKAMDVPSLVAMNVMLYACYLLVTRLLCPLASWKSDTVESNPSSGPALRSIVTPIAAVAPATRDVRDVVQAAAFSEDDDDDADACDAAAAVNDGNAVRGISAADAARRRILQDSERSNRSRGRGIVAAGSIRNAPPMSHLQSTPLNDNRGTLPQPLFSRVSRAPPNLHATPSQDGTAAVSQWILGLPDTVSNQLDDTPVDHPLASLTGPGANSNQGTAQSVSESGLTGSTARTSNRCIGKTVAGRTCRNKRTGGTTYCSVHLPTTD